jgi:3-phenylpropionate/trans-cinnamate dioxygenase ferredoxin reductase subunit
MTPVPTRPMVIVGAGHAGGRAAQALREFGWTGPVMMIGAEPHLPYERPPLSKGLLTGEQTPERCVLMSAVELDRLQISPVVAWVERIDPARRALWLTGGPQQARRRIDYEGLLLATGGHLRRLDVPGAASAGVIGLRTLDDAARLAPRLQPGARVLIVGGGFIGLEVAASARQRGCEVLLLEAGERLLGRAVPAAMAERVLALHRTCGVDVRLGCGPAAFALDGDGRRRVTLADGRQERVDLIVAGIGIEPAVELAREAGLAVGRGITVDATLATSAPGIFAAGDVAEFPGVQDGRLMRHESWHNAETQARVAAANLLGRGERLQALPWFWSDQYDHQIQVAGDPALGVREIGRVLEGEARIDFHLDAEGRLVAASGFGPTAHLAREFRLARWLLERGARPAAEALADPGVRLRALG